MEHLRYTRSRDELSNFRRTRSFHIEAHVCRMSPSIDYASHVTLFINIWSMHLVVKSPQFQKKLPEVAFALIRTIECVLRTELLLALRFTIKLGTIEWVSAAFEGIYNLHLVSVWKQKNICLSDTIIDKYFRSDCHTAFVEFFVIFGIEPN